MRDFVFSRDALYAVALYGATLAGVLAWLFWSKQRILLRSGFNAFCIAARLAALFAALLWLCWITGIASMLAIAVVVAFIALGVVLELPVSGVVGFALLYIVQQFVLGFPARHEWMLSPPTDPTKPDTSLDHRKELIGAEGITTSPLRPIGDVKIDGQTYTAKTNNGQMLSAGHPIVVSFVQHGTLLVKSNSASQAES